ncbi:hypothetical protein [Marinomonas balearica]|uniref:Uncharacterized protein n=1 Tax=Marinomonas balearica TaxID=491947 RepID=A0A4R6MA50_9GAMM|nr:hypothetical protein [Marinomonas balearica]TDO98116.1 hypothetical protein DFP79_1749 [Marinomonas balearica]
MINSLNVQQTVIQERRQRLSQCLDSLFGVLVGEDKAAKLQANRDCLFAADQLVESLPTSLIPAWLSELQAWCRWYKDNFTAIDANAILFNHLNLIHYEHFIRPTTQNSEHTHSNHTDFSSLYKFFQKGI